MKAKVIIGANLGDEGKGTITARLACQEEGKVLGVLTNGGAQRGHTVLTEDYGPITFHHFSSASWCGADNYFSRYFILNPMQFVRELKELRERSIKLGNIVRHPDCLWTTPYDMMANQIKEELRGTHGSCGMGVWETIKRYRTLPSLSLSDFVSLGEDRQLGHLLYIKAYHENILGQVPDKWLELWNNLGIVRHFIEDCRTMCKETTTILTPDIYNLGLFEGGQGLKLSDTGLDTPDTTPSKTGSAWGVEEAIRIGCTDIELHYVSRTYETRHGDGWLKGETGVERISGSIGEDIANKWNSNQGHFRYAPLDLTELKDRIRQDAGGQQWVLDVTHCDEVDLEHELKQIFNNVNLYEKENLINSRSPE